MELRQYGHITPIAEKCHRCGSAIGITPMDLKSFRYDIPAIREEGRVDDKKNFFRANCCICGAAIIIGVSRIPKPWRELRSLPEEYRYYIDKFYPKEGTEE